LIAKARVRAHRSLVATGSVCLNKLRVLTAWAALAAVCCGPVLVSSSRAGAKSDAAVVDADNAFGLKLLKTLTADAAGNVAVSPTSVAMALQIVLNGAKGATRTAMLNALQLRSLSAQDINVENQVLQASLASAGPQIQLIIANSLWVWRGGRDIAPSFKQINEDYYWAEIGDLAGAPDNVNAWISRKTNGLIAQVLPAKKYDDAVAVIANAIYFKGDWAAPFDPKSTQPGSFTTGTGRRVSWPMMRQKRHFPYFRGPDFRAIRLAYGTDRRLSMVILLPNDGVSLGTVVAELEPDTLKYWLTQFRSAEVELSMPRFKVSYKQSLPAELTKLGMGIAFDATRADFSGIVHGASISDVEHATLLQVDESGTTAAAATTVTVVLTALSRREVFSADHPFFYAITDEVTGAWLFVGTLEHPT
jgi:serine protease inhibitor